jgi:hypothetical protein
LEVSVLKIRAVVLFTLLSSTSALWAQQGRGTILGTVTDASGAGVAGANVSILNTETNNAVVTQTNSEGFYTSPPLIVGSYQISIDHAGFKKEVRSGVSLAVDQRAEVNARLEVGAVGESVQVSAQVSLINTQDASIGQVVENKRVQELPINGRSAFALVGLAPNVKSNAGPTQSGFADRGTNLSAFSINGGPTALNLVLVDGMVATQSYYPDLNADLAVDAVQEFKVQSGSISAEYGFTAGGVINMATKSGTNSYHGSLYEFDRNKAFNARNAFGTTIAPFRYNQYGLALGGPVYIPKVYNGRNRTFFFGNWEQYDYYLASQIITTVPTPAQRGGDFSQSFDATGKLVPIYDPSTTIVNPSGTGYLRSIFPGNIIPANRLDKVALNMQNFYPLANRAPTNAFTNANNYIGQVADNRAMQQYTIRIDQSFSDRDTMYGRYTYFRHHDDNGAASPWPDPAVRVRNDNFETRNTVIGETHTFSPTILNEIRIGTARQYFPFQASSFGGNWPQKLGLPASVAPTVFPSINNGLTAFSTGTVGIRGALTWDFTDTVTIVRGSHTIRTGMEVRLLYGNNFQTSAPSGSFVFAQGLTGNPQSQSGTGSAYATFLVGAVSSATDVTNVGESEKGYDISAFVQDQWKVSRKLSLSIGLRYDFQLPGYERNNGTTNFNPYVKDPLGLVGRLQFAGQDYGRTALNANDLDFGPRFGFAYDLTGNSKTVVRGGYSIFYPSIFHIQGFGNTTGFAATTTTYNPPGGNTNLPAFQLSNGFPTPPIQPQGRLLGPDAFLGQSVNYDQPNQKTPMSQQWDFSLQRQLPGNWMIDVTYSGNHGTHNISGGYSLNQLDPQYLALGNALQNPVANPYAGIVPGSLGSATITRQQSLLAYPYYSAISVRNPHMGNSIYHAGLLTVEKRFSQGLTFLASYTKAKLIDDSVATPIAFGNVEQVGTISFQNSYNFRGERSLDPTDVSQRLVLSGIYELPVGKGRFLDVRNNVLDKIVGGWQLQSVATLQDGVPVVITGASNNLATRPNSTGQSAKLSNRTAAAWFNTAVFVNPPNYTFGNVGRTLPDVRNPGVVQVDLSISKSVTIREKATVQFRAESFNVANHTNLGFVNGAFGAGPNGLNNSSTFGTITSARDPRSIQLGLKIIF